MSDRKPTGVERLIEVLLFAVDADDLMPPDRGEDAPPVSEVRP